MEPVAPWSERRPLFTYNPGDLADHPLVPWPGQVDVLPLTAGDRIAVFCRPADGLTALLLWARQSYWIFGRRSLGTLIRPFAHNPAYTAELYRRMQGSDAIGADEPSLTRAALAVGLWPRAEMLESETAALQQVPIAQDAAQRLWPEFNSRVRAALPPGDPMTTILQTIENTGLAALSAIQHAALWLVGSAAQAQIDLRTIEASNPWIAQAIAAGEAAAARYGVPLAAVEHIAAVVLHEAQQLAAGMSKPVTPPAT